ncbi:hypothetical protein [Mesorhizobium sp. 113-3-9]|uniref:hypothetical protein n=1 Tax=Mesorhizobium sp. 113-3-9 TaxID=2744517 RepID=UPI0019256E65|nr:hypothetical protein [Mesorhizobium sp. 113-3-9]
METTFDDLGKALERHQHTPAASVAAVAVALAVGLGIIVALVGMASTSGPQVPHNVGLWGEQHAIG